MAGTLPRPSSGHRRRYSTAMIGSRENTGAASARPNASPSVVLPVAGGPDTTIVITSALSPGIPMIAARQMVTMRGGIPVLDSADQPFGAALKRGLSGVAAAHSGCSARRSTRWGFGRSSITSAPSLTLQAPNQPAAFG